MAEETRDECAMCNTIAGDAAHASESDLAGISQPGFFRHLFLMAYLTKPFLLALKIGWIFSNKLFFHAEFWGQRTWRPLDSFMPTRAEDVVDNASVKNVDDGKVCQTPAACSLENDNCASIAADEVVPETDQSQQTAVVCGSRIDTVPEKTVNSKCFRLIDWLIALMFLPYLSGRLLDCWKILHSLIFSVFFYWNLFSWLFVSEFFVLFPFISLDNTLDHRFSRWIVFRIDGRLIDWLVVIWMAILAWPSFLSRYCRSTPKIR